MAATTSGLKRPLAEDETDGSQKRSRSNNGSPVPTAPTTGGTGKLDMSKAIQDARARAAEVAARLAKARGTSSSTNGCTAPPPPPPATATTSAAGSVQDKIAEMKARVAAAKQRATAAAGTSRPPASSNQTSQQSPFEDSNTRARGGLDIGLHPALLADSGAGSQFNARQSTQPKFGTTTSNRKSDPGRGKKDNQLDLSGPSLDEIKSNPYFDPSLDAKSAVAKGRASRQLHFNQQGKYIQQAAQLRKEAALEAMKKKIAESAKKAGMTDDIQTEKAFMVEEPPSIEWWDEDLVDGDDYAAIDKPSGIKLDTITRFVVHPVAIEPPQEKMMPAPKPMFLTPKEQKKRRRQERKERLKEEQMKVRLGLQPPAPPKVKKSNLMRVLGEEAVRDPTAVEARVNREIAERAAKHHEDNQARALTKEERAAKLAAQQEADAKKGVQCCVFKVDSLANGRHRFKVSKNAEQQALTGICILNPKFCLVIVEGGAHSIKAYKKLMLNRIDWTENSGPNSVREGNQEALAAWLQAEDEKGNIKDLGLNKCTLVWEGEQRQRAFQRWGNKVCETDQDAKEALRRNKMESFWTLAKSQTST